MLYYNDQPVETFVFPGGEVQVKFTRPSNFLFEASVLAFLNNSDDVMSLVMLTDALQSNGVWIDEVQLTIPYFPYARQDRINQPGEARGARAMAQLINRLGYRRVTVYDPHSDVVSACLDNVRPVSQTEWVMRLVRQHLKDQDVVLVAPDAGAQKKARESSDRLKLPLICANKVRDVKTGWITKTTLNDVKALDPGKRYLVIDDICDGGATFIPLAEALREAGAKHIDLHVTHGLFSKGLEALSTHFERITCSNSRGHLLGRNPSILLCATDDGSGGVNFTQLT